MCGIWPGRQPARSTGSDTHLIYTHGYGVVAATAARTQPNGNPNFIEGNIPPTGVLGLTQPRVYFGHEGASYVIVGGHQRELDFPNESSGGQRNTTYQGTGGVPVGSFGDRLLFAIRFRELNILISSAIDGNSRIMYIRDPLERVQKVAPFLTLDGDPYPVVDHGQIVWVVDGYTTTDDYPYSKRINLDQATSNTYSPNGLAVGPNGQVNYIRNSVKATVNAYTGAVHIYQWGKASPVLKSWKKSFPGLVSPQSAIPSELLPHLRYPEVLFDAQREILAQFHVTQPASFYGGQNFWEIPADPTAPENFPVSQPPYYLTLDMPGVSGPQFSLTTLFTPRNRPNLAAYMAVNSNPVDPSGGYGKITLLQLPQATAIPGPQQVQSNFEGFAAASEQLKLLRGGGSKVTLGNQVTVPLGGSLLSVEPVYVSASSVTNSGAYPQLQRVLTFYYFGGGAGQQGRLRQHAGRLACPGVRRRRAGPDRPRRTTGRAGKRASAAIPRPGRDGLQPGADRPARGQARPVLPGHPEDEDRARRCEERREGLEERTRRLADAVALAVVAVRIRVTKGVALAVSQAAWHRVLTQYCGAVACRYLGPICSAESRKRHACRATSHRARA